MTDELSAAKHNPVIRESLQQYTAARVALGHAGPAIPMREQLRFQLDHALARDAVHAQLDVTSMLQQLQQRHMECLALRSAVNEPGHDRQLYLRRPDLGRKLHQSSRDLLLQTSANLVKKPDVVIVIADGLSALAVEHHALPLLDALTRHLLPQEQWRVGPVCVVSQGRVAIGDEIGDLLNANLSIVLIGERPGLSAFDSLGVYMTWNPRPGRTDAERNCISNIRLEGLGYDDAAQRIAFYMDGAKRLQGTGVALKEDTLRSKKTLTA
jgi:ethanolamine ammonia-lyase small subunit